MMRKTKAYSFARFDGSVLEEAVEKFKATVGEPHQMTCNVSQATGTGHEDWEYDTLAEFLAEYRKASEGAKLHLERTDKKTYLRDHLMVTADLHKKNGTEFWMTIVTVTATDREKIEGVFSIFEKHRKESTVPAIPTDEKAAPCVFIGHGRSAVWRDLKDHLREQHGYEIEAYETGARAGHTIRDVLEDMLDRSSFAVLVMTAEDEAADGTLRARQNVVHEAGLFQGKLGFSRAIVALEEGCEEFSNIQGVQQLRFGRGNIREIFGDVLATLRREFGGRESQ